MKADLAISIPMCLVCLDSTDSIVVPIGTTVFANPVTCSYIYIHLFRLSFSYVASVLIIIIIIIIMTTVQNS